MLKVRSTTEVQNRLLKNVPIGKTANRLSKKLRKKGCWFACLWNIIFTLNIIWTTR